MPRRDPTRRTARLPSLLDRVIQNRRAAGPETESAQARPESAQAGPDPDQRIRALEERVGALEDLLEGLQDSVHREGVRREQELEELGRKVRPAEIARVLEKHAREHGL